MRRNILILLLLFVGLASNAQTQENCLLWEISGKNLEKSSYIYGTIHLIPADKFFFYDEWHKKFLSCEVLVLEADINVGFAKQMALFKKIKLPSKTSLSDYMSEEDFAQMQSYLLDTLKISKQTFRMICLLKPFFSSALILDAVIPGKKIMYEKYFSDEASKNKMRIAALETIDYQLSLVDSMTIEEQIKAFLFDPERTSQTDMAGDYAKLVEYYRQQNVREFLLASEEMDGEESRELMEIFLQKRNREWLDSLEKIMQYKPSFIAVGAAHLFGDTGVLRLLEEKGYVVKPVFP